MNWAGHWLTTREFARMMGRPERTVQLWAQNGTLVEFGLSIYQVGNGRFNRRHYIQAPANLSLR